MAVRIQPFEATHAPHAAALVAARIEHLRTTVPAVPPDFTDPARVEAAFAPSLADGNGVVALATDGSVVGHLCWHEYPTIRRVPRRAVHIPEFGSSLAAHAPAGTRDLLFAAAAQAWDRTARQAVAVTQLVGEPAADEFWIDNGFGRFLHDGVRPCTPIDAAAPPGFVVRPATPDDLDALVQLDREHCAHYALPPTFMVAPAPATVDELAPLLAVDTNPVFWIAADHDGPQAFLRAEQGVDSCSRFLQTPDTVAITGIFTRPAARGRGVAAALLDAALRYHAARGIPRFAFDHETINPTARAFWPRHLTTVARSYLRVFERT
jgi:GNAT superfamily N-acetyltransferase